MKRCLVFFNILIITTFEAFAQVTGPEVSDIIISGLNTFGAKETATYTFATTSNYIDSGTTFQWYSASDQMGNNAIAISENTLDTSFILTSNEIGKFIKVVITPSDNSIVVGTPTPSSWIGPIADIPPVVSNVVISGTPLDNSVLSVSYTYSQPALSADNSTIQWFSASDIGNPVYTPIPGATTNTLLLTPNDVSKLISVEITPTDAFGTIGTPVSVNIGPVQDLPPTATNAIVSGNLSDTSVLTANYTYNDFESDIQSGTIIQWYSSLNSNFSSGIPISGATNATYTLIPADADHFIGFQVTPADLKGSIGSPVQSLLVGPITHAQPILTNLSISGTVTDSSTLTATYTFTDPEGTSESGSAYQWFRSNSNNGASPIAIQNAITKSYQLTKDDVNQFIGVKVTPKNAMGTIGSAVQSNFVGPIINLAPKVSNLSISGILKDQSVITAIYAFHDYEGDNDISTFQWFIRPGTTGAGTSINGATSKTYALKTSDAGKYLSFIITPTDSRNSSGLPVQSNWIGPVNESPPTVSNVVVSGNLADSSLITVSYLYNDINNIPESGTTFQWFQSTNSNGANSIQISGANESTYRTKPADVNKYISCKVTPQNQSGSEGSTIQSNFIGSVTNVPPIVSNITITGNFINQSPLSSSYAYHDMEGNGQSGTTFQWFRANDSDGNGATAISGATTSSYTLTTIENNKYVALRVTPKDNAGQTGINTLSIWFGPVANAAPIATNVQISGIYTIGQTLSATFTYSDIENNAEGNSLFKWYKSSSSNGTNPILVQTSTDPTYVIKIADINDYFRVLVTPIASTGTTTGIEVPSPTWTGPVFNEAPTATDLAISGNPVVCKTLTATYSYSDNENDLESVSTFRWLKATSLTGAKTPIIGETTKTYILKAADVNNYIYFEVTPKASTGALTGIPVLSDPTILVLNTLPNVTFSPSSVSVCQGNTATITLTFTGTAPFHLTYSDSLATHQITTSNNIYTLTTLSKSLFKGISLTDNLTCPVTNLPSQSRVKINPLPIVNITNLLNAYSLKTSRFQLIGSPAGGVFSGTGVVLAGGLYYFDPSYAGVTTTPIPVIYKYTSACSNSDTVLVTILDANAFISGFRTQLKYCNFDAPILITGATNVPSVIGTFTITGNLGLTDHRNNTATVNPGALTNGSYTITYSYFDKVTLTVTKTITIETVNKAQIIGISTSSVCANAAPIAISGFPATGVFKGSGIVKSNNTYVFDPAATNKKLNTISFIDSTSYGCKTSDNVIITISPVPLSKFQVLNNCWNGDSTIFINQSTPADSINSWNWNFGDGQTSTQNNNSTKTQPSHKYSSFGNYSVTLISKNILGCSNTSISNIHLGDNPKSNFTWDKECFNKSVNTLFTNLSQGSDNISQYNWTITENAASNNFETANIQYTFSNPGDYNIKLKVTSIVGCKDSLTRRMHLRPTFKINDSPYINDFENPKNLWYIEQEETNNIYWGQPSGLTINTVNSGVNAYYTKFSAPKTNQQIIVSSPCLDFTDVQKPYIQMWVNYNTTPEQEGAVLQYSVDESNQWNNIGSSSSGQNWYSSDNILSAPGGQRTGWTGNSGGWVNSRSNMDQLINQQNVKLRIVYGANTSAKKDGFAFDNLTIGKRLKTALFEHFANISNTLSNYSINYLDSVVMKSNANSINLQYHTSFPGTDSLNLQNQMDPGARILYYGSGVVPICYLDGGIQSNYIYDFTSRKPNIEDINLRTLNDVDFDISFQSDKKENSISGIVQVKAMKNISNRTMTLQIAIAEDINMQSGSSTYILKNVLKQLVPTAAGTSIISDWSANQTRGYNFTWQFKHIYDSQNINVIAFLQDDVTHEIYQAATTQVFPITAIPETINTEELQTSLYPNPASEIAYMSFSYPLKDGYTMIITNDKGIQVSTEKLRGNINALTIPTAELKSGLYIIRLMHKAEAPIVKKLIVIH